MGGFRAVSGGADSVFLLHGLDESGPKFEIGRGGISSRRQHPRAAHSLKNGRNVS